MTWNMTVGLFHLIWLSLFSIVNLHNILIVRRHTSRPPAHAEAESPCSLAVVAGAVGTIAYFLNVLLHLFLSFTGLTSVLSDFSLEFESPLVPYLQSLGMILTSIGYSQFIWSVTVRGKHAVSWAMSRDHKLITSGPYRYVRHPSYMAYFLMFLGLFFTWPSFLSLVPMAAIPGYLRVTSAEEKLLVQRFGDEYLEYQKRTGRFIPRFSKKHGNTA